MMCGRMNVSLSLSFIFLAIFNLGVLSQNIPLHFFGQNAWMPDTIGSVFYNGKLHKHWGNIQNSGTALVRFGGISPDKNKPTNFQYIKMIDSIRAKGMEPIMQVPYHNGLYSVAQATAIVNYVNVIKGKNIKYWIIGNEPDLEYSFTTASQVSSYIKPFATAMKAVDPSILIIGPETAWFNQSIINGLTNPGGPDDITGKDASGRYYVDIISFHYYPFNGTQTRASVLTKLTQTGGLQDNLVYLNNRLLNCNNYHSRSGTSALKTAITEANINYQNSTTDNLQGLGVNSFIGGQFISELMAVGMKNKVDFINIWSVIEGNSTALNIGYLDRTTGAKKPMYYHYKMVADNFRGTFAGGTTNTADIKTFGSKSSQFIQVMVLNQQLTGSQNFTLRLNTGAVTGVTPVKLNINASVPAEYSDNINNQTTILLTFDLQGTLVKKCIYSLADHAAFNLPPSCTNLSSPLPVTMGEFGAYANSSAVVVNWRALHNSLKHFIVERSADGLVFDSIAVVKSEGDGNVIMPYEIWDHSPNEGVNYYRLRMIDFNNERSYSKVAAVNFHVQNSGSLLIFPNPVEGNELFIAMEDLPGQQITISLSDMIGRTIEVNYDWVYHNDSRVVRLTPKNLLPSGIYIVTVSGKTSSAQGKFVVRNP